MIHSKKRKITTLNQFDADEIFPLISWPFLALLATWGFVVAKSPCYSGPYTVSKNNLMRFFPFLFFSVAVTDKIEITAWCAKLSAS